MMISFRQADLLETYKNPLTYGSIEIDIPADPQNPGRAHRNSTGQMYAMLSIKGFPNNKWEQVQTMIELALGQRIGDKIYSRNSETFGEFSQRVRDTVYAKLRKITSGRIKATVTMDKVHTWHLEFGLRLT